jgi:uncharacterized protein YqjF (DUF2071 family)
MPGRFLTAEWRHLLMLNFAIDPRVLTPHLPSGTELDLFSGRCFVSVVGFWFLRTRLLGVPIPFHVAFEEINLRFYVSRGPKRGVVFLKEVVDRRAVSLVARWVYNENYATHRTGSEVRLPNGDGRPGVVGYRWKQDERWNSARAEILGEPRTPPTDSLEHFLVEHYFGYTRQRDGGTMEYEVRHPPWKLRETTNAAFDCDVAGFYGPEFVEALSAKPTSAFVADGSAVEVYRGVRIA